MSLYGSFRVRQPPHNSLTLCIITEERLLDIEETSLNTYALPTYN